MASSKYIYQYNAMLFSNEFDSESVLVCWTTYHKKSTKGIHRLTKIKNFVSTRFNRFYLRLFHYILRK